MTKEIGVAEAKRKFSELMSLAFFSHQRFYIKRRGKVMAALVGPEDIRKIEECEVGKRGLLKAVRAWADFPKLDELIDEIYGARSEASERPIKELGDVPL